MSRTPPEGKEARRWGLVHAFGAGHLLRELRERAGVTPKVLCARVPISLGQLSDIERGVQSLSLRRAEQITAVLGNEMISIVRQVLQDKLDGAGFRYLRVELVVVTEEHDKPEV